MAAREPAVAWGWPEAWSREELLAELESPQALAEGFTVGKSALHNLGNSLRTVALAYALPQLADQLTAEAWWQLAEALRNVAFDAGQHRPVWPADPHDVVCNQLLAGELPLALGYLLPELAAHHDLAELARDALSEAIIAITDGEGFPHARLLPVLGPLLACWTRCRWLGKRMPGGNWSDDADVQYMWLVRSAMQLTGGRGQFVFAEDGGAKTFGLEPLFAMALELVGDKADRAVAAAMLPKAALPASASAHRKHLPKPSLDSDWSGVSILASSWEKSSPRLVVTYVDEPMGIHFAIGGEQLFSGTITSSTSCDGQPIRTAGLWEQLCWHSDKHCDYLELGIDLTAGLRLERQLIVPRSDRVMFIADVVLTGDGASRTLRHTLRLPIGPDVTWHPEAETRDGVLVSRTRRAAVLPLGLQEWRSDPRGGNLDEEMGRLALTQETTGRALYCPLFLDFKTNRTKKERTWRQLTVAEALVNVPRDVAVAYRAQSGRRQWLVYRSLAPAANRTFMGQNISGEFCAGRFPKSGEIDEWIEVEAV